jgi:hypothetical protein
MIFLNFYNNWCFFLRKHSQVFRRGTFFDKSSLVGFPAGVQLAESEKMDLVAEDSS